MGKASKSIDLNLLRHAVQSELVGLPGLLAVYLHGSTAQDIARPDSDIDLAVLMRPGCSFEPAVKKRISEALAYRLGRTVDLGEISSRNLVFAAEVLSKGKELFAAEPDAVAARTNDLLSLYVRFNEDRKEVLDAYRAG